MRKLFLPIVLLFVFFAACSNSPENEKQNFETAKKNINDRKYKEAVVLLEKVAQEEPEGKYTPLALLETAKLYHNSLVPDIPRPESITKAIKNYKLVFNNFPQDSTAELALFLTGFIFSNDLNQYDSAKTYYEMLLEKYPKSKFVSSAKMELENFGLTPEEILAKKLQNSSK
ncbi:MAG: tetratricopeptide repeat protein [Bacteroidota bacterium]